MAASSTSSITISGAFQPSVAQNTTKYTFEIVASGSGTNATYKWKKDLGAFTSAITIHTAAVAFDAGLLVSWADDVYVSEDEWVILARANEEFTSQSLGWLEDGSKRDLLGYNSNDGDIKVIKDFLGAKETVENIGSIASRPSRVTIIPNNKEVHIGCGPHENPKWLGRNQYSTFGGANNTEIALLEGELTVSQSNTGFLSTACMAHNGDIYGAEEDGTQLLKMTYTAGAGTWTAPTIIDDIEFSGIMKVTLGTDGSDSYVWILDKGIDTGVFKKYDITNDTLQDMTSTGILLDAGLEISDIVCVSKSSDYPTGYASVASWDIWASAYKVIDDDDKYTPSTSRGVLWHTNVASANFDDVTALAWTCRDPLIKTSTGAGNGWGSESKTQTYTLNAANDPDTCDASGYGDWSYGSATNWYTQLYKRALTIHSSKDFVYHLSRQREIDNVKTTSSGMNGFDTENNITVCNRTDTSTREHFWINGTGGSRENYLFGMTVFSGVKSTHTNFADAGTTLHLVSIDLKVTFDEQNWLGPTGLAYCPSAKSFYMSSNDGNTFSNGKKWIHIPCDLDETTKMAESGAVNIPGTANQIGSPTVIYETDRIDIVDDPNTNKALILGGLKNQKAIYLQSRNTVAGTILQNPFQIYDGTNLDVTFSNAQGSTGSSLWNNKKLFYKVSFVYDGYQESPLSDEVWTYNNSSSTNDSIDVTITIQDVDNINRRVSHINLYRANGIDSSADKPLGFYRLIESNTATQWGNVKPALLVVTDKPDSLTGSYESRSGISESMTNSTVRWGIGTVASGSLIVGDCGTDEFSDASTYLFKSRPGDYDKFNWALDFLRLPFKPVALATFQSRIYCWSNDTMLRINPDQFYIEDSYDGFGCLNKNSLLVTEFGLFFADKNNVYMHNGQVPTPIGSTIIKFSDEDAPNAEDYLTLASANADKVVMALDAKRQTVVIFMNDVTTADEQSHAFAYSILRQRWDIWEHTALYDAVTGNDGYIYHSDNQTSTEGGRLFQFMSNTAKRRNWIWNSKRLDAGQPSQDKIFKKLRIVSDDTTANVNSNLDFYYRVAGNKLQMELDESTTGYEKVSSANKKAKDIKFLLTSKNNYDLKVSSVGAIFRRRPVK